MLPTTHPDYSLLAEIENELVSAAGSLEQLCDELPGELRRALDEVIDTERTGRVWVSELEKTEKTYIGTKVEIVVRAYFSFQKGRLDLRIANHDVDVKNTIGRSWMIPKEAVGCPCLLFAEDDEKAVCSAGLIVAQDGYLTGGSNRDGKRGISAAGLKNAWWLFRDRLMKSFWSSVSREFIGQIMDPKTSGTERLRRLFKHVQGRPISREVIRSVARQKDYMKRLRKNGGARDPLAKEGVVILGGAYGAELIGEFGLPTCGADEFISFAPSDPKHLDRLRREGFF